MTVQLRAGAATDVGRVRTINQDSFLVLADRHLYVVADGMGGHQGGEVASRIAIDALRDTYGEASADALTDAIADANDRIHAAGAGDESLRGMGTTVVAAALVPRTDGVADGDEPLELLVANVGDSRAYVFRSGELTQLTEDHSMVADLMREGRITAEEAEVHPQRNIVTRVLGVYEDVDIDLWPVDPIRGDRYLLCSDGLFTEVGASQIGAVLRRLDDPQEAAAELVRLANEGGGRDNVTVLVLDVLDDGGVAEAASAALADAPSTVRSSDPAGFSTALDDDGLVVSARAADEADRAAARPVARPERRSLWSRLSWRGVVFTLGVLVVLGGAIATIQWYGTSTYFVGFDGDEVAIYQGRPGGLLWIDPSLEEDTGIEREDVPQRYLQALEAGQEQSSLAAAKRYVSNIERDIIDTTTTTTTTTTTLPTTVATTPTSVG
jgi:protein phosphatase